MFEGKPIQECDIDAIGSVRRNPVIADLFHRIKYMERRGSGLKKILSETKKLPGYSEQMKPEFYSSPSDFRVMMKNINYNMTSDTGHDAGHDTEQVANYERFTSLLKFCSVPHSREEMQIYVKPLVESGQLEMTLPDRPKSKYHKYITSQI